MAVRERDGRRDDADPRRRHHPLRPCEPGRDGPRLELVYANRRENRALHARDPRPVPEVCGTRQQPRLLRVLPAGIREHEPADVPDVVSPDRLQPPPDGADGDRPLRPAVQGSLQLQHRPHGDHRDRPRGGGDALALHGGGQAWSDATARGELLDLVERRPAHDAVLPQHDRASHGNDREPDPHGDPADPRAGAAQRQSARADRAAAVALPAVDRLLGDREQGGARPRFALPGDLPVPHLAHGDELDRPREQGQLDDPAQARRLAPQRNAGRAGRDGLRPQRGGLRRQPRHARRL